MSLFRSKYRLKICARVTPSVGFRDVLFYDKGLLTALSTSQSEYLLCQRISFKFACSFPQTVIAVRTKWTAEFSLWRATKLQRVRVNDFLTSTVCVQRHASAALPPGKNPGTSSTCGTKEQSGRSWRREDFLRPPGFACGQLLYRVCYSGPRNYCVLCTKCV